MNLNQKNIFLCFMILWLQNIPIHSQNWLIDHLIPPDYNRSVTPFPSGQNSLQVTASLVLYRFKVPFEQDSIETNQLFCLHWTDHRIRSLSSVTIQHNANLTEQLHYHKVRLTQFDRFWLPQADFRNADSVQTVHSLNEVRFLEVWPDQKLVKTCAHISASFSCPMTLSSLPFDQQFCYFELEAVPNILQSLQLQMQSIKSTNGGNWMFRIRDMFTGQCQPLGDQMFRNATQQGNCVYGAVHLVRHVSYFVVRYYAPSFLTVMMSILEFWIPVNAWPSRIILTATVLLGLIRISISAYNTVPVGDVVSLFWWLWGLQCIIYIFMCELALAQSWQLFVADKKKAKLSQKPSPDGHYFGHKGWYAWCGKQIGAILKVIYGPIDHYRDPINRNKVDYVARLVFPLVLGTYTIVYIVTTIPAWAEKYRY